MDAPSTPTPDSTSSDPEREQGPGAGAEQGSPDAGRAGPAEAPAEGAASAAECPAEAEEQAIALTEASFLVGVSVQALRQRLKRGTLEGADARDARGQRVAGVLPSELARAFPERAPLGAGAMQSKPGAVPPGRVPGGPPAAHAFDTEADLERGGMAPPPAHPPRMAPASAPAPASFSPWSLGLLVAIAAVAVAGLVTGAREARAANRMADAARAQELHLSDELRTVREQLRAIRRERDEAVEATRSLQAELDALRAGEDG